MRDNARKKNRGEGRKCTIYESSRRKDSEQLKQKITIFLSLSDDFLPWSPAQDKRTRKSRRDGERERQQEVEDKKNQRTHNTTADRRGEQQQKRAPSANPKNVFEICSHSSQMQITNYKLCLPYSIKL